MISEHPAAASSGPTQHRQPLIEIRRPRARRSHAERRVLLEPGEEEVQENEGGSH